MSDNSERIVAGMALIGDRYPFFGDVWERLRTQVDKLYVSTPKGLPISHPLFREPRIKEIKWQRRKDDARKFAPLWSEEEDFYFFSVDDDLLYPEDYVERMVRFLRFWDNEIVACVHGSWITEFPCESYYKSKDAVHFAHPLDKPRQVLFPGTGTTAFHTSAMRPREGQFPLRNIADVQLALAAQDANMPVLSIPRREQWIRQHPEINALQDSIWAERRNNDGEETDLINGFASSVGWEFPALPDRGPEERL